MARWMIGEIAVDRVEEIEGPMFPGPPDAFRPRENRAPP